MFIFLEKHIVLPGRLTHEQMFEEMKKSNVFVLPSCIENHSSTLREAMTVGSPCIASDVGSAVEFVKHGENGFLCKARDIDGLANVINQIVSLPQNDLKLISSNAVETASGLTDRRVAEYYIESILDK